MNVNHINLGLLILRATLGGLMLLYGIHKLIYGIDEIQALLAGQGIPAFLAYGVYLGELVAPLLMIIGYRTRLASLVFAGNMLVAMLIGHGAEIFTLTDAGAWGVELVGLYLLGSVALFFTGAGTYAVSTSSTWD
jgi:putative oxidoreductase